MGFMSWPSAPSSAELACMHDLAGRRGTLHRVLRPDAAIIISACYYHLYLPPGALLYPLGSRSGWLAC